MNLHWLGWWYYLAIISSLWLLSYLMYFLSLFILLYTVYPSTKLDTFPNNFWAYHSHFPTEERSCMKIFKEFFEIEKKSWYCLYTSFWEGKVFTKSLSLIGITFYLKSVIIINTAKSEISEAVAWVSFFFIMPLSLDLLTYFPFEKIQG